MNPRGLWYSFTTPRGDDMRYDVVNDSIKVYNMTLPWENSMSFKITEPTDQMMMFQVEDILKERTGKLRDEIDELVEANAEWEVAYEKVLAEMYVKDQVIESLAQRVAEYETEFTLQAVRRQVTMDDALDRAEKVLGEIASDEC